MVIVLVYYLMINVVVVRNVNVVTITKGMEKVCRGNSVCNTGHRRMERSVDSLPLVFVLHFTPSQIQSRHGRRQNPIRFLGLIYCNYLLDCRCLNAHLCPSLISSQIYLLISFCWRRTICSSIFSCIKLNTYGASNNLTSHIRPRV